jgi:4'-phosphopantetheinyl transferase
VRKVRVPPNRYLVPPWRDPPEALSPGAGEVHVWRAALDQSPTRIDSYLRTLAPDERARAERFHFPGDREHFIVARGVLRAILGLYLNRAPERLSFRYGPHGKPALTLESAEDPIRFNLSHSHGVALYAIASGREVGIDLEPVSSTLEVERIAERFFSPQEISTLRALPATLRRQAFFLCWTRKEAYIKARGEGLSLSLDQFDVSLIPGEPAVLLRTRLDSDDAQRWALQELSPELPGYAAALAVEGDGWSLALWQWASSLSSSA